MNKITIKCPNCDEKLVLQMDDNFKVVSVKLNQTEMSNKEEISEVLKKHNIELG